MMNQKNIESLLLNKKSKRKSLREKKSKKIDQHNTRIELLNKQLQSDMDVINAFKQL